MLVQDLRCAWRHSPRFCLAGTVILRPLFYAHPERMVMRRVVWMLAAGTAADLVPTVFARRVIGILMYVETQREAGVQVLMALLLVAVGLLAVLMPAVRAASIEPMQALRTE